MLQVATSISNPGQLRSSLLETEQFRLRVVSPPPHVFVHAVHELHSSQPSPEKVKKNLQYIPSGTIKGLKKLVPLYPPVLAQF